MYDRALAHGAICESGMNTPLMNNNGQRSSVLGIMMLPTD